MVRWLDHKKRQGRILNLVIKGYVQDGKPISSEYLREKFNLPCSTATLRNIMSELEDLGYLSHIHRSSGRVPTQAGYRYYVNFLMEDCNADELVSDTVSAIFNRDKGHIEKVEDVLEEASKIISTLTHYTGLGFVEHERQRLFFWGTRFMLEEPEFGDVELLRNIFMVLEEKVALFNRFIKENLCEGIKVFIGDEIGLEGIRNCSIVLSSLDSDGTRRAFLGVLGPVRMNYSYVVPRLKSLKDYLETGILRRV